MRKLLALLSAGLLVAAISGCGTSPAGTVTITITSIGTGSVTANGPAVTVNGTIEADSALTDVVMTFMDSTGNTAVSTTYFQQNSFTANFAGKKKVDLNTDLSMVVRAYTVPSGTYQLKITATSGSVTSTSSKSFTVTGGSAGTLTLASFTMGADSASDPSLLDADSMNIYSNVSTPTGTQAKIDAIFSFSTVLVPNALAFTSPSVAAGAPYNGWTNKPATEFKKVTATWSNITTQADINTLWGTGAGVTRLAVSQGDIIVIKTSLLAYKVVQIATIVGSDSRAYMDVNGKF